MNYGSLGGFAQVQSNDYGFFYRQEIYSAFGLTHQSMLQGLYYPCPKLTEDGDYKNVTLKHDFIITPIQERFWKASARIHIFLRNEPGTLRKLCEFLKEEEISIVHSESTRSSFRYSTWSLHIVFNKLLGRKLTYLKEKNHYRETNNAVRAFIKNLKLKNEKFWQNEVLYHPANKNPIKADPNYTLAFFADYIEKDDGVNRGNLFMLTVNNKNKSRRNRMLIGDPNLRQIITKINDHGLLPATTFSEIDTKDLNLRTTLIPDDDVKRFLKAKIHYDSRPERQQKTYVGVINAITMRMPPEYSIWHSFDRTLNDNPESGEIVLLIEDLSRPYAKKAEEAMGIKDYRSEKLKKDEQESSDYERKAENVFKAIIDECNYDRNGAVTFATPTIYSLPKEEAMREIIIDDATGGEFQYDLFISYSHFDEHFVKETLEEALKKGGVDYVIDHTEFKSGDYLDNSILTNIQKSREMCVVVSDKSKDSKWMSIERGAAWSLRKRIAAVKADELAATPEILLQTIYVEGKDPVKLEKYVDEIIERRNKYLGKRFSDSFFK